VSFTGTPCIAEGNQISFQMINGSYETLIIAHNCAGLDSLFLFIGGFVAFIMVENPKLDKRIGGALILGILTAYFANIFRMVIIVSVGVNWGKDAMMATHENAGTLIFLGWIAIFWCIMYKFVLKSKAKSSNKSKVNTIKVDKNSYDLSDMPLECAKCGKKIDPDNVPDCCPDCNQQFDTNLYCNVCGRVIKPSDIPEKCPKCGNAFG